MNRRAFDATFVGQRRRRGDRPDETREARDAGWPAAAPTQRTTRKKHQKKTRKKTASNFRNPAQAILRQVLVCLRELSRTRATPTIIQLKSHATSAILTPPSRERRLLAAADPRARGCACA